jgi:cobalt-zinc-cadmium efflux system outer membrane protein
MTDTIGRQRARVALLGLATAAGALLSASAYAQSAPPFAQLFDATKDAPRQVMLDAEVDRAEGLALQARARPIPASAS